MPNCIVKAVIDIKKKRQKAEIYQAPVILTPEFAAMFENFTLLATYR